jgi:hypothetical protein
MVENINPPPIIQNNHLSLDLNLYASIIFIRVSIVWPLGMQSRLTISAGFGQFNGTPPPLFTKSLRKFVRNTPGISELVAAKLNKVNLGPIAGINK